MKIAFTLAGLFLALLTTTSFAEERHDGDRGRGPPAAHALVVGHGHLQRGMNIGLGTGPSDRLYLGNPCWTFIPMLGWTYACD
jgi:hypothetical protein